MEDVCAVRLNFFSENFQCKELRNIGGCLVNLKKSNKESNINPFYFWEISSFTKPNHFSDQFKNENILKVIVDNSFSLDESDKEIIFLDHHLTEEFYDTPYSSNTRMLIESYDQIVSLFKQVIKEKGYEKILTLYHNDGDGIMSAIIMKMIYQEVFEDVIIPNKNELLYTIKLIGDTFDVSKNVDDILDDLDGISLLNDGDIFKKKITTITKGAASFFKTIKTCCFEDGESLLIKEQIDELTKSYGKENALQKAKSRFEKYFSSLLDRPIINVVQITTFLNLINSDKHINDLISVYNMEKERIVKQFVYPEDSDCAVFDVIIRFNKFPKDLFRLFVISSPFDLARSVSWSVAGKMNYYKKSPYKSNWAFYLDDYDLKDMKKYNNRRCVLNVNPFGKSKLSLDDTKGDTGYKVAKELFNGGGHKNEKDSIGSAELDESDFYREIEIIELL